MSRISASAALLAAALVPNVYAAVLIDQFGARVETDQSLSVFDEWAVFTNDYGSVFKASLDLNTRALPQISFSIDLSDALNRDTMLKMESKISSDIVPNGILFSVPLVQKHETVFGTKTYANLSDNGPSTVTWFRDQKGMITFEGSQNLGGYGLAPSEASAQCASFSCMIPYQAHVRYEVSFMLSNVPEPMPLGLSILGAFTAISVRRVASSRHVGR
jgi:hypothetical protein